MGISIIATLFLVVKYAFQGPKLVKSDDVDTSKYYEAYCDENLQIYVFNHETTEEASKARWEIFMGLCKSVSNVSIFDSSHSGECYPEFHIDPENKFIAISDLKEIWAKFSSDQFMVHALHRSFSIDHELALNKLFCERLSRELVSHGFIVEKALPQENVTMFGKSQPDISIYRQGGGYIKQSTILGGIVDGIIEQEDNVEIVNGGTIEMKMVPVHQKKRDSPEVRQLMANMIRLGGFLASKAFEKGHMIDEIKVYGLLVSHKNPFCLPLRYKTKCSTGSTTFMIGDEMEVSKAIKSLLACI